MGYLQMSKIANLHLLLGITQNYRSVERTRFLKQQSQQPNQTRSNPNNRRTEIRDKALLLKAIEKNAYNVTRASKTLMLDRDIAIATVTSKKGYQLAYTLLHETHRDDPEILKMALKDSVAPMITFSKASARLRNDNDIAKFALAIEPKNLRYLSNSLRNDYQLVSTALLKLELISDDDIEKSTTIKQLMMLALEKDASAVDYIPDELKGDTQFICFTSDKTDKIFELASDRLKSDIYFLRYAEYKTSRALRLAPTELRDDEQFVLEMVQRNGDNLCYASERLVANRALVIEAVISQPDAIGYASPALQNEWFLTALAVLPSLKIILEHPNLCTGIVSGIAASIAILICGLTTLGSGLAIGTGCGLVASGVSFFNSQPETRHPVNESTETYSYR